MTRISDIDFSQTPKKVLVIRQHEDGTNEVVGEMYLHPFYVQKLDQIVLEASEGKLILGLED